MAKSKAQWNRILHRDFAYFYVGLIIAFSFSGIILNHRQDWYPSTYTYEAKNVEITIPDFDASKKEDIMALAKEWNLEDTYDGHRVRENKLRIYFKKNNIADIDLSTKKGTLEYKRRVPFLGHTIQLHKSTHSFWIWYSDIFGGAMLLITITGLFIPVGKNGFKKRGWKFAIAGLLFPLIFLFLF